MPSAEHSSGHDYYAGFTIIIMDQVAWVSIDESKLCQTSLLTGRIASQMEV